MYEKYLVLVLLFFIGGNIIGISFQFYNDHHILAQSNQESEADDQEPEANQEPEAGDQEVSVDANGNVKITLDGKDDDKDDEIEFDIVSDPSHGQLDNFDKSDGKVTYAPDKDYSGDDEFKFKVTDNNGAESNTAEVRININSINLPIQGTGNEAAQGTGNEVAQAGVSNETNQGTGNETNQEVVDNQTTSTNVQTNITEAANRAPTAYDQSLSTNVNDTIDITLVGDDADNDTIQFAIVSNPSDASLNNFDLAKGTVTYIPQTDYVGNDTFAFKVIDDKGAESNTATVSVNVTGNNQTNQPPQVFDQSTDESNSTDYRYAVWSTGEEEDRYILFSRSNDGGNSFSSPLSLSGKSRSAVFNPEVSSSGNNVYVVWQGQSKNGNQDIFLRKSSDYGSTFSETENLSNDPGGSGNPDVTIDGNSTHIAWEGTTPGNNFIFYTKSDEGSDFDSPQKLSSNTGISYNP
jgi:hypothetical protein